MFKQKFDICAIFYSFFVFFISINNNFHIFNKFIKSNLKNENNFILSENL